MWALRVLAVLAGSFVVLMGVLLIYDSLGRINGMEDPSGMTPAVIMIVIGVALIVWGALSAVLSLRRK